MDKHGYNVGNSTANRGVEAKEMELANTHLDRNTNTSSASSAPEGSSQDSSGLAAHPALDVTGSYVQVVVQKHRRERAPPATSAAQTSPRLPAASSPIKQLSTEGLGAGDGVLLLPASVLLACPPRALDDRLPLYKTLNEYALQRGGTGAGEARADARAAAAGGTARSLVSEQKIHKNDTWNLIDNVAAEKLDISENGPERVEVYPFEHGSAAYLAARAAGRVTRAERVGRRAARAAGALLAEPLAAAQLLLHLPVALLLALERCALTAARDLVAGGVQTAADFVLKPALTLAFNAGAAPALACAGNVLRAARAALRPLWLAAADALAPAARLLGQLRLVHVQVQRCRCRCPCPCPPDTHAEHA